MEDSREMAEWLSDEVARLAPLAIGGLDAKAAKELQAVADVAMKRCEMWALRRA